MLLVPAQAAGEAPSPPCRTLCCLDAQARAHELAWAAGVAGDATEDDDRASVPGQGAAAAQGQGQGQGQGLALGLALGLGLGMALGLALGRLRGRT